jgi:hypothetical protein
LNEEFGTRLPIAARSLPLLSIHGAALHAMADGEPEQAAQITAKLCQALRPLEALVAAVEQEFMADPAAGDPRWRDDEKVFGPDNECHITFGMIRNARKALSGA